MVSVESKLTPVMAGYRPGWFSRLLLRMLPVPVLVRSLLEEMTQAEAGRPLQFVEDAQLPGTFLRYLRARGADLGRHAPFFLHDRQSMRGGLLLAGQCPDESPDRQSQFREELEARLKAWLRMADRGPDDVRLMDLDDAHEFFARRFVHFQPVCVLLWAAERPGLERLLGAPAAPSNVLRLPVTSGEAGELVATGRAVWETSPPSHATPQPAVQAPTASVLEPTGSVPDPTRAMVADAPPALPDPTEVVHSSGLFQYQVVGHTRGSLGRKYCVRREGPALRIALLCSREGGERPATDYSLAFFERLAEAQDGVRAHREFLRETTTIAGNHVEKNSYWSLSLELDCDTGRFRCLAYGISPLFFRRKTSRLYLLPDSLSDSGAAAPGDGVVDDNVVLKTVEGQFRPSDALLVVPGRFTMPERRDLAGRYRDLLSYGADLPDDPEQDAGAVLMDRLADVVGPWLDSRLRGRALLLGRS